MRQSPGPASVRHPLMREAARALAAWVLRVGALVVVQVFAVSSVGAQRASDDPRRVPLRPQWEIRAEAVASESPAALAGLGVNIRAGWYTRLGVGLAGGARWIDGGPTVGQVRADATVRFLLDPFAERKRGLYGGVGLSATQLGGGLGAQSPVLLLVAGAESRPRNGRAWALELGLGGGLRVGVVRRAARADGYR